MIDKLKSKNTINDEFKYVAKLLSRATLSFLKINLIGQISIAVLCIITMVVIVSQTFNNGGGPVHTNGVVFGKTYFFRIDGFEYFGSSVSSFYIRK